MQSDDAVRPVMDVPVMNPKSLVVFCPNCCITYEKKGLQVADIVCTECGDHGCQLVVEVRRYEDVHAAPASGPCKAPCTEGRDGGCNAPHARILESFRSRSPLYESVIDLVYAEPGITSREINNRLGRTGTYASMILGNLVDAGILVLKNDPADRRVKRYYPPGGET